MRMRCEDQSYCNLAATCVHVLCHTDVYNFQHIPLFSKKMSHEINRAFRLVYKGTFCKARHIKFGRNLGGFGADMFEAEINKLKEKNRTLC